MYRVCTLKGFSLQYYAPFPPRAIGVTGWVMGTENNDWAVGPVEPEIAAKVLGEIGMKELTGFTLFKVKAGWQMSTRDKGETGWNVEIIPDNRAQALLMMLGFTAEYVVAGHRTPTVLMEIDWSATESALRELTEAVRAYEP